MTSPPLPWLAVTGATQILQQGLDTSQSIAQAWDQQWLTVFDRTLYVAINQTAAIFAASALIFFIVQFGRQLIVEGDLTRPLQNLIWPIIVVCLLANNAHLLTVSTVSLRSVIHTLSNQVIAVTLLDVKLRDAVQSATSRSAIASEISAQLSQCEGMVGQKQIDCLTAANAQVQATINEYQGFIPLPDSFRNIARAIDGAVQTAQSENNPISGAVFGTAGFFAGFLGSVNQKIIQYVLLAFQWAFTNILEISMLLTGLMGPFAVAGSLLPFEAKPLFAWLTGFFSLGMAQVSYNITVGLAGVVVVNADVTDTLGFLVIIGLLAPALALAIAAMMVMSFVGKNQKKGQLARGYRLEVVKNAPPAKRRCSSFRSVVTMPSPSMLAAPFGTPKAKSIEIAVSGCPTPSEGLLSVALPVPVKPSR